MSTFYQHLLPYHEVSGVLDIHLDTPEEREQVLQELEELFHHAVMEYVLHTIPLHAHDHFLAQFSSNPADHQLLLLLRSYDPHADVRITSITQAHGQRFIDAIHS